MAVHIDVNDPSKRRFFDDPKAEVLMCSYCKHRTSLKLECEAYPNGIPRELLLRGEHDTPFPGDHGYRFERKED